MNNQNLIEMLDNSDTGIYVTDLENYELLYLNKFAKNIRKALGNSLESGFCYKCMMNKEEPCSFCKIKLLKKGEFLTREFYYPPTGDTFEMKGTLIDWDGKLAHIEYIRLITSEKQLKVNNEKLKYELNDMVENVPCGLCLYYFDGKNLKPLHHNENFYQLMGYNDEHRKRTENFTENLNVHPDDIFELNKIIANGLKFGGVTTHTYRLFHDKTNKYIRLRLTCNVKKQDDGTAFVYAQYDDVTELEEYREKKMSDILTFEELERKVVQSENSLTASIKLNLTDNCVLTHRPGVMTLETLGDFTSIDEFQKLLSTYIIDKNDCKRLIERFSRDYLLKAKHENRRVADEYRRVDKYGNVTDVKTVAFFTDTPIDKKEYAVLYTYDITSEKQKQVMMDTIVNLNYDFVSLFDCNTGNLILNKIGKLETHKKDFEQGKYPPKNSTYDEAFNLYLNNFFSSKEKELFKNNMNFEHILNELKTKSVYVFSCLSKENGISKQKMWTVSFFDTKKDKIILTRADVSEIYQDNIEKTEKLNESLKQLNFAKEIEYKYKQEVAYLETANSKRLLVKVRVNVTENVVESYSADGRVSVTAKGTPYNIGLEQLAVTGFSEEERNSIRYYMNRERVLKAFEKGERTYSIDYRRKAHDGSILWANTIVRTIKNPENGDIISFMYTYDINEEHIQNDILKIVTGLEYDYIAHLDLNNGKCHFYRSDTITQSIKSDVTDEYIYNNEKLNLSVVAQKDKERMLYDTSIIGIQKNLENNKVFSALYSYIMPDGSVRKKQIQYAYIDSAIGQVVKTRTDVTDLLLEQEKQHQKLQKALSKAQEASHAKSDFLSRVSHDMRTPMNGIIGLTNITLQDYNLQPEVVENLTQIQYSSEYLLRLVNDTLDINRMELSHLNLNLEDANPEKLIENVLTIAKVNADKKGIEIAFINHVEKFHILRMDSLREQQIWLNIISNAIKFTPCGGRVEIELEMISEQNNVALTKMMIRDNGIGIGPEFLPHVFEPFAQEHSETTNQYGGTGLGMSIVKNLVELMGGTITVESELGEGTTFTVITPFEWSLKQEITSHKDEKIFDFSGKRVLLCEDHPLNQKVAKRILEKKNILVEIANNGLEGVEKFKKSENGYYDAILMDIRMPVMDGLEATKQIRALPNKNAKTIPIIAMTANAFDEDRQNSFDAGMNAHIAKPIDVDVLYKVLAENM